MQVTVALVGDPAGEESGSTDFQDVLDALEAGEGTPYAELRSVTLDVSIEDTLSDVLGRAAQELGLAGPGGHPFHPTRIAFYEPSHEQGYRTDGEMFYLTLVDSDGRALWGVSVGDPRVTMEAVQRAYAAGLIDGDPSRPYLLIRPTVGNGVLPNWHELVIGFLFVREALGLIADGAGAAPVAVWTRDWVQRIRNRMLRTPEIFYSKTADWRSRGAWPNELDRLLGSKLWSSEDLARLLGIFISDVEALLQGRGMVKDDRTGYWRLGEDRQSRIVNEVYEFGFSHEWSEINDAGEVERIRTEIRRILTRGMEPEAEGG